MAFSKKFRLRIVDCDTTDQKFTQFKVKIIETASTNPVFKLVQLADPHTCILTKKSGKGQVYWSSKHSDCTGNIDTMFEYDGYSLMKARVAERKKLWRV